jgi:hypothetical protein
VRCDEKENRGNKNNNKREHEKNSTMTCAYKGTAKN